MQLFKKLPLVSLILSLFGCDNQDEPMGPVIAILGSSTAAGVGPDDGENAWVARYATALTQGTDFEVRNLAVSGYNSYHIQADDYSPPASRPAPDSEANISAALALSPIAIIINLPSNDQDAGYTLDEQLDNFARVVDLAQNAGAEVWITTTQPRNFEDQAQRDALIAARDAIESTYADRSIDFWRGLATEDGTIDPAYDADGIHLNDAGHEILAQRVIDADIPAIVAP